MSRPSAEVIALVDARVAQRDAATIDEPVPLPATSSYSVIAAAWEQYKARIDALDAAVADPFAVGATSVLVSGITELIHPDHHQLVFWLGHVAAALGGTGEPQSTGPQGGHDGSVPRCGVRVGDYDVAFGGPGGEVQTCTTWGRTPIVGEEIELDGRIYVVQRVRHQEVPSQSSRRYTAATCFVRLLARKGVQ